MGFILFIISLILLTLLSGASFIFAFFRTVVKFKSLKKFNNWFLDMAIAVDQLGNVMASPILNLTCIKSDGYQFGNTRETVSLVLAINNKRNKLTKFGTWLGNLLDLLDPNHLDKTLYYHTKYINNFKK